MNQIYIENCGNRAAYRAALSKGFVWKMRYVGHSLIVLPYKQPLFKTINLNMKYILFYH